MSTKKTGKKGTKNAINGNSSELPNIDEKIDKSGTTKEQDIASESEEQVGTNDIFNFFNYQRAINSLIDYLNQTIDDIIASFTHSDQVLFSHTNKKLILNAILESGYYEFCKFRLSKVFNSDQPLTEEKFLDMMRDIEGEVDLLGYLLVNTRLVHRTLTFDLYLSLLKGGLFEDIMDVHGRIIQLASKKQKVNKENIKDLKIDHTNLYI